MAQEQGENRTPEERTAELFSLKADALFERLRPVDDPGMVIALIDSERKVRVRSAQPFSQVGNYYKAIGELKPGTLWNPAKRAIAQSLIVTPSEGRNGACVRLLQVDFFDPTCHEFVPEVIYEGERFGLQEGSIARYLGLGKGNVSELKFRDNTDTLYVTNTHQLTTKS